MAGRLLSRYGRLLGRASSQAPAAAAAAARLPPPVARLAEVQRAQGWPWATHRLMSEGNTVAEEDSIFTLPTRTKVDELVKAAAVPEDVLVAWELHGGNGHQAASALVRWTQLMVMTKAKEKCPEFLEDPRLLDMMDTVSRQTTSVWNSALVGVLHSLWVIGLPPNDKALRSIQTEVLWRIRRMTYKQLVYLIDKGASRRVQHDVEIVDAAMKQIELRWTEISEVKTVCALISKGRCLSPALMEKLEDKVLELAETLSAEDISRVCVSLAAQSRRSVPLLRVLSHHLLQKPSSQMTTATMLDMTFAYGKLNFQHSQVFQRIASELLPTVPALKPPSVTRFAKSFGLLKWLHIPLFEAFAEHYTANSEKYNTSHLCNLLMAFARLNFKPSKEDLFFSKVQSALEDSLSGLEPFLRTDVVWSFCVLQQTKPSYLIPLIQQSHTKKLSMRSPSQVENYRLKFLHIAATLQLEHPGSSDIPSSLSALFEPTLVPNVSPMQNNLRTALQSWVGGRTEMLRIGVDTVYGWTIDGELVVDCDNNPIDLSVLKAPHLPGGGGDQALPAGAHRLAFVAWEFPNLVSKTRDLLGRFAMMKRHLQLAGFVMVEVPYYEWLELKTDWQKVAYLKDKLAKAVAEEMAK